MHGPESLHLRSQFVRGWDRIVVRVRVKSQGGGLISKRTCMQGRIVRHAGEGGRDLKSV